MPPRRPHAARSGAPRPEKTCLRCGRPFTWRRKWARDWEGVRYCSDRCRRGRSAAGEAGATDGARPAGDG